jgi:hypothetical protein
MASVAKSAVSQMEPPNNYSTSAASKDGVKIEHPKTFGTKDNMIAHTSHCTVRLGIGDLKCIKAAKLEMW